MTTEVTLTFHGPHAEAVAMVVAENEALKARLSEAEAQRDAALAEVARLRTVKLPEIDEGLKAWWRCTDMVWMDGETAHWTQDVKDFVDLINEERRNGNKK